MDITITIADRAGLGGCSIEVTPKLEVLESAAGGDKLTNAGTYALGALNAMRRASEAGISNWKVPRPKHPRAIGITMPIKEVKIRLSDNIESGMGGVRCVATPSFATLAGMVAAGCTLNQVHKFALVGIARVYEMSRTPEPQRYPAPTSPTLHLP
jgi:hypothetical protein